MMLTLGGDRLADREHARMVVGAVAEVGEHVLARAERRLADPGHALAAHLRPRGGRAVHPDHHAVAADAGHGDGAFGHACAGVVRAARAEPRQAVGAAVDRRRSARSLRLDHGQARVDMRAATSSGTPRRFRRRGDGLGDERRRQVGRGAQQPVLARAWRGSIRRRSAAFRGSYLPKTRGRDRRGSGTARPSAAAR